jgi:hypothetical protein
MAQQTIKYVEGNIVGPLYIKVGVVLEINS